MSESPQLPSKYDGSVIKQALDDVVIEVLLKTYKENTRAMMVTSVLGVVSVAVACFGQFMVNFPAQRQLLAFLIVVNIIVTVVIQVYSHYSGVMNLFRSKPSKFRPNEMIASSHMDRFSPTYSLTLSSGKDAQVKVEMKKEVNEWIRSDGRVDKEGFETDIDKLIEGIESAMASKKQ